VGRIAVIGPVLAVQGFGLAGALVRPAEDADAARAAWRLLPDDVAVVLLTADAAAALPADLLDRDRPLVAVLP
jgi:vacuolar-type H+-ATPase subunit F/Vma7